MPKLLDFVFAGRAIDAVQDDDAIRLEEDYGAAVGESGVAAGGVEEITIGAGAPIEQLDMGWIEPSEGIAWCGLIEAVDADGVVGGGTAEGGAESGIGDVGAGAGVDEEFCAVLGDDQAQGVGMAVTRAEGSEGAGVAEGVDTAGREDCQAGIGEEAGLRLG